MAKAIEINLKTIQNPQYIYTHRRVEEFFRLKFMVKIPEAKTEG